MSSALVQEKNLDRLFSELVRRTIPLPLQPHSTGRGFKKGRYEAYKLFPMSMREIPRGLLTSIRHKLAPPIIHLGYLVDNKKLIEVAQLYNLVSWKEKESEPPAWDDTRSPDEQLVVSEFAVNVDEHTTVANVMEFMRTTMDVPEARMTRVCLNSPDTSAQLLSLSNNLRNAEDLPSREAIAAVANMFDCHHPPQWFPDYMWGDWRSRANPPDYINPTYHGDPTGED